MLTLLLFSALRSAHSLERKFVDHLNWGFMLTAQARAHARRVDLHCTSHEIVQTSKSFAITVGILVIFRESVKKQRTGASINVDVSSAYPTFWLSILTTRKTVANLGTVPKTVAILRRKKPMLQLRLLVVMTIQSIQITSTMRALLAVVMAGKDFRILGSLLMIRRHIQNSK